MFGKKGQTAIEYLTTYGWAILAIGIVAAAIIVLLRGAGTCPQTVSGAIANSDVRIQTWKFINTSTIDLEIANLAPKTVTLQNIEIDSNKDGSYTEFNSSYSDVISTGGTVTKTLSGVTGLSTGCNDINIRITYTMEGLNNPVQVTGSLRGPI